MPRFSANLSMMFRERPMLERLGAARAAGFAAVEIQFPYDIPLDELDAARKRAGVEVVLLNIPAGDKRRGERGLACLPDRVADFRAAVETARRYAARLGATRINLLPGNAPQDVAPARCRAALVDNIRHAAQAFADIGVRVCMEALNAYDAPGFFVTRSSTAIDILDEAAAPNAALLYDVYHMQRMEGELTGTLARLKPRIGHIQVSDVPGRREPGKGEINFPNLFAAIDAMGYDGWVGAEYEPTTPTTEESLGWFAPWRSVQPGTVAR
jgi:hydroxypyruvate isomerase